MAKSTESRGRLVAVVLLSILGATIPVLAITEYQDRWASGVFAEAHFLEGPGGPALLLIEKAGRRRATYRMDLVDAENGKRRLRRMSDGVSLSGFAHDDNRVWMYDSDLGLHARNPRTLDVLLRQRDIEAHNPQIRDGIRQGHWKYDAATGGLWIESRHGEPFHLDANTEKAQPGAPPPSSERRVDRDSVVSSDGSELLLSSSSGLRRANPEHSHDRTLRPELRDGRFVSDPCSEAVVRLDGPESYLVMRDVTEGDFHHGELLRIKPDGTALWTTKFASGKIAAGHLYQDRLVLVFEDPENAAVALDARDGRQLWRYAF